MLEQIASNRMDSVFELSADLTRLFFWAEECVSVKGEFHSLLKNIRKYSELVMFYYKQCLTAKIVSNAKDEKYMLTKNEKPTTMLKSFILDNLRDRSNEVLQQSKNNYIDVVVAFIFSVNSISLPTIEPSPLVVKIVEKEYSKLLNLMTAISIDNNLVCSWVEVLAYSTREDKFLDKLSFFYRKYSRISKQSDLEYVNFVSFLGKNKFIQHSSLRAETLRNILEHSSDTDCQSKFVTLKIIFLIFTEEVNFEIRFIIMNFKHALSPNSSKSSLSLDFAYIKTLISNQTKNSNSVNLEELGEKFLKDETKEENSNLNKSLNSVNLDELVGELLKDETNEENSNLNKSLNSVNLDELVGELLKDETNE